MRVRLGREVIDGCSVAKVGMRDKPTADQRIESAINSRAMDGRMNGIDRVGNIVSAQMSLARVEDLQDRDPGGSNATALGSKGSERGFDVRLLGFVGPRVFGLPESGSRGAALPSDHGTCRLLSETFGASLTGEPAGGQCRAAGFFIANESQVKITCCCLDVARTEQCCCFEQGGCPGIARTDRSEQGHTEECDTVSIQLATPVVGSRVDRIRRGLTAGEWSKLGGMAAFIVALNVIGWFTVVALVAPHHYSLGTKTFGILTGVTAYTLGMRHAFDADHIAAIDNTTRKLMDDGKRPLSVGFWFSLGHSSVVFILALLLSLGIKTLVGPVKNDNSRLHHYTSIIGTGVSGTFLYIIAIVNIFILVGIMRVFRDMRRGTYDEATLEEHLANRGLMNRILRPIMRFVTRPGQMYGVGLLFGLGFDTVTEVALLVLASAGAASGLPWYAILCLPVLFAAGMCLFDTIDGTFMNFAYGWAFSKPVRKVYYNITITSLSVAVALIIGTVELVGLLSQQLNITGRFWIDIQNANINMLGVIIVGLFVVTWVVALLVWKFGNIEQKWAAGMRPAEALDVTD